MWTTSSINPLKGNKLFKSDLLYQMTAIDRLSQNRRSQESCTLLTSKWTKSWLKLVSLFTRVEKIRCNLQIVQIGKRVQFSRIDGRNLIIFQVSVDITYCIISFEWFKKTTICVLHKYIKINLKKHTHTDQSKLNEKWNRQSSFKISIILASAKYGGFWS